MKETINTTQRDIVNNAKSTHEGISDDVISEITTLLESTMSSKEMSRSEINEIANRLVKFQIQQNKKL